MSKILITGGGGFIGVNLARKLLKDNEVTALDNGRRNSLQYFPEVSKHKNFRYAEGDILDEKILKKHAENADIIIHLAAMAGVSTYYKEPFRTLEVNTVGTYKLLRAMEASKAKMLINFSSSEVYGTEAENARESDMTTQGAVPEKRWIYGVSKIAAEHMCFAYGAQKENLTISSVRPFNVYGPGQTGEGAIRNFISKALRNEDIQITNDGKQERAWCYVKDAVQMVELIIENPDKAGNNTFNLGNHEARCSIKELAKKILELANSESKITYIEHLGVDIRKRYPNIDKARKILGFKPAYDLEKGLKESIEWYKNTGI